MVGRKFVLLLLLIEVAMLRGSHGQDSSSRSSRREASDSESTTFVGYDNRAKAYESVCYKTEQRLFNDFLNDVSEGTGRIFNRSISPVIHTKPVISKSYQMMASSITLMLANSTQPQTTRCAQAWRRPAAPVGMRRCWRQPHVESIVSSTMIY